MEWLGRLRAEARKPVSKTDVWICLCVIPALMLFVVAVLL